jgi:cytochrome c biogenesis protein CcdA
VTFRYLEVYHNTTNRNQFLEITASHNTTAGVPALVIGNTLLVGEVDIRNTAEQEIILLQQGHSGTGTNATPAGSENCPTPTTNLSLPLVIGCALVDSINPCGLAVLVFLLVTMTAAGSRKRTLVLGGTYIFATFLFHLLVGIGLFSIFSLSGLSKLFSIVGGLIAILFGVINLADLYRNKETFFLSIPESHKGLLGDYIRLATLPAAFVLGILAGILGFTCTGGIYISILGLMGQGMTVNTGLQWLLVYNLIFVLPLILVTLLVAYGVPPERADQLRTSYKRPFRAIISVVLIALGVVILLGWIG